MMTIQVFLGVSLFALLIVDTSSFPLKGTTSKDQSSSPSKAAVNLASDQGAVISGFTAVPSGAQSNSSGLVRAPSPNQAGPGIGSSGSYVLGPVIQAPGVAPFVQMAPAPGSLSSAEPVAGYSVASGSTPRQAGYDAISTQPAGAPYGVQETYWVIAPRLFSDDDLTNTQAISLGDVLPPVPLPPSESALQSETSRVMKEAELGNYKHLTEFGYPADSIVPEQGFKSVPVPPFGVGVFRGYPYPNFDYRLLYGMYPPGTFIQQHEKDKDYFQDVHYLTEHITDGHNTGQQKKLFPSAL